MRSKSVFATALSTALIFVFFSTLYEISGGKEAAAAPEGSRWGADYFPNHPVVSHNGKTFRFYEDLIKDKLVVVNFIYTYCPDICSLSTSRMAEVQKKAG